MKKITTGIVILFILIFAVSCTSTAGTLSTVTVTKTVNPTDTFDTTQLNQLQSEYDTLQAKYDALLAGQSISDQGLADLQTRYNNLQTSYDKLIKNSGQTNLRNPSWEELKNFVKTDNIDQVTYNIDTFACTGYATILRDRARTLGFRTAIVQVLLPGTAGHVFDAIQTSDAGLVYIDCTQADKVAYIQIGQPYGMIAIDAVRYHYIDTSGSPKDFYEPLSYKDTNNPFNYAYYQEYEQRRDFYNKTIAEYNVQVIAFNDRRGSLSKSQMDNWSNNIQALGKRAG